MPHDIRVCAIVLPFSGSSQIAKYGPNAVGAQWLHVVGRTHKG
jgi:hypothetical protein